ncbi:MAG: zf-TFIIB domain-containing protein [Chloroflexi bacterium]|nr:zf-TFIIB domain-containing protein [Chloroflexota bacterium]
MNCPVCSVELRMSDRVGVEIDYCPQCRGIWLDSGELDKIIERSSSPRGGRDYERDGGEAEPRRPQGRRESGGFLGSLLDIGGGGGD